MSLPALGSPGFHWTTCCYQSVPRTQEGSRTLPETGVWRPRLSWLPFPGFHLPDSPPWGSESSLSVCSLVVSDNRPTPTFWSFASESPIYRFRKCVAKFSTLSQWGLLNALSLSHSPFLFFCFSIVTEISAETMYTILVPYCCSNKLPRFSALKLHKFIILQIWRSES